MAKAHLLGNVNLFGLNAQGKNPGMSPLAGAGIGAGASIAGELIAGKVPALADKSGTVGFAAGLAASAALYFGARGKHRHAAVGSLVGTVLAQGLPWLRSKMGLAGLGIPQINYLNGAGLGVHQIEMLNGGLGLHTMEPVRKSYGTIPGVAGLGSAGIQVGSHAGQPPVSLLGESTSQSRQVTSMGGPAISGLSTSYGATLFGVSR